MKVLKYLTGAWLLAEAIGAQHIYLPEVKVQADRLHLSPSGLMEFSPDSFLWKNKFFIEVTDLLRYALPAVVRQYGPGMITTFRVRGLASEHLKVVWNGLSINNAAMGLFDFSGVPGLILDQMAIYQGNMSGFYGSGAGSGAILLYTHPVRSAFEASLVSSVGSFGYRQLGGVMGGRYHRLSVKASLTQHLAKNDFEFTNLSLQRQRLANGSYIHTNAQMDVGYHLSSRSEIHLALWKQNSFINIPPSRVESRFNTSRQWNENLRSVISLSGRSRKAQYSAGGGLISEKIVYENDILRSSDTSQVTGGQFFARGQTVLSERWSIMLNTEVSHFKAPSAQRASEAHQTLIVVNPTIEHKLRTDTRLTLSMRQEWMDGRWSPPVFRLSSEKLFKILKINISAGNHFRWPTLNERFWLPGGNPNLKPETGYTAEMGLRYSQKWNLTEADIKAQPFVQQIGQLIIWQPVGSFWSPINVQSVRSQGIEARAEIRSAAGNRHSVSFQINYCFNRTEVTKAEGSMAETVGKQLIYSPLHIGNTVVGYTFKSWQLLGTAQLQSAQHTLSDNHPSGLLKGFYVINTLINKEFIKNQVHYRIGFEVRNLLNAEYHMVAQRPMPGREYRLNLLIHLQQPKISNL